MAIPVARGRHLGILAGISACHGCKVLRSRQPGTGACGWYERSGSGLADVATYNDYQLVLALNSINQDRSISSFEIGYVFERELEYRSRRGDFEPPETFFIRLVTQK